MSLLQRMGTNKAVSQAMRRSVPLDRSIARLTGGRLHLVPRALLPQLIPVRAQRLTESQRTAIWLKAIAVWPAYRDYERWADDRTIDLYRLEPT